MSSTLEDDVYCRDIALLQFKNSDGLVVPSSNVVAVCKTTERSIRRIIGPKRLCPSSNVRAKIVCEVLSELLGTKVFYSFSHHGLEIVMGNNHQVSIMKTIASEYITLKLYHQSSS